MLRLRDGWGTQAFCDENLREIAPTMYADEASRERFTNWLRAGASPAVAYAINRIRLETDLRHVYPAIRVPTLVLYRAVPQRR